MAKGIVLIIDDEADLIELVRYNLEHEGYTVVSAIDGESGLSLIVTQKPDIIVVDLMLPGIDGLEVCRRLRANSGTASIPILILTAKASEADRVVGLELGADDYMTKPFSPRELSARIKALLRRSGGFRQLPALIRHGSLSIDPTSHEVRCGTKRIDLTATEYRLLQFLASHPGFVYSRSSIIDGALGRDITVLERTIDVHIMSLRKKLGKCGLWVETIRGFGYKFREASSQE
ncbi:MAG: response regulator [Acidobacteria bacterium]|nr:response regulator [Acidobacteriota bacterium]